ncbi:MAG TPA: OmpA family protein [Gammaproteobacteria bacterium]|nr:OmpA family protein [Gammaproteobacteria bacterium]
MKRVLIVFFVAALFAGCGGNKEVTKPDTGPAPTSGMDQQGARTSGIDQNAGKGATPVTVGQGQVDEFDDPSNPLSRNLVHFDYNSAQVKEIDVVNAHGAYLANHPSARVRLEGHADERGSREFNVALSERRAQSVKQLMMFQGARANQFEIVAYGEERPLKFGHNEAAWAANRRVEIIYESK